MTPKSAIVSDPAGRKTSGRVSDDGSAAPQGDLVLENPIQGNPIRAGISQPVGGYWQPYLITYIAYVIGSKVGLMLAIANGISPVWPASGIALAMMLHYGYRIAPAIFIAGLTEQFFWTSDPLPLWFSLASPIGATLEPIIATYLLRRFTAFDPALPRFRDVVTLVLVGAPIGPLLNGLFTITLFCFGGAIAWSQFKPAVETFWFGNAGGVLMMTTVILVWLQGLPRRDQISAQLAEASVILLMLAGILLGLPYVDILRAVDDPDPIAFLCFPLIAWASIRLDLRLSCIATLLVAVAAIIATRVGTGAFLYASQETALFVIQLFILSLNVTNQLLGALARQKESAEERLRDREEFLTLAVHGGNDGLFDFRRPSKFLWLSPRWKEQLGYEAHELPNTLETWERLILPEDREKALAQFSDVDRDRTIQSECLLRFRHKQGHVVHILCRLSVRRDEQGRVTRLVGTHTDISDLMNAREELEHQTASLTRLARDLNLQRREAEAANEAKSAFLATVSHEVRTPLNGVIGMIGLLLDTPLEADQQRYANTALASAEELLIILNSILDVSKLEAGRLSLDVADCDLPALVEGIVALFSARAASKGISLSAEIAGNVPPLVRGDPTRLRQILMNLVGNAIKFTLSGDVVIRVGSNDLPPEPEAAQSRMPRYLLTIDVVDTGIGIAPTQMDRLFDRFRQADDSITRRFGGTGLGLTICKQLIELMGGQIIVESQLGRGSTFRVMIPCLQGNPSPDRRRALPPVPLPTLPPCHVLVVEDNPVNSALVSEMLGRAGHRVTTAENGAAALAAVARDRFDVILMDVQMPEVDGVTATQWIRDLDDSRAHTPIIALTADTMTGSRERFLTAGFSDYLEKPVRAARLLEAIARQLRPTLPEAGTPAAMRPRPSTSETSSGTALGLQSGWNTAIVDALRQQLDAVDFEQLIELLSVSIAHDLRRLRTAIDLSDYDACHVALQNLGENAAQLGADGLTDLTQRLSAAGNSVETVLIALPQLQSAAERLVVELEHLRAADAAAASAGRA